MMNRLCGDALLVMCLGVAMASADLSAFQTVKFSRHFQCADCNGDGVVTIADYQCIADQTMKEPGYTKYTAQQFASQVVPAAWAAFPNMDMTKAQYLANASVLVGTPTLTTAVTNLSKIMYGIWNYLVSGAMTVVELKLELQTLKLTQNLDQQAADAYGAMNTDNTPGISEAEYIACAVKYFSSDDQTDPSRYFLGDLDKN